MHKRKKALLRQTYLFCVQTVDAINRNLWKPMPSIDFFSNAPLTQKEPWQNAKTLLLIFLVRLA